MGLDRMGKPGDNGDESPMTEDIGGFTVDSAEGILKPAIGTIEDPPAVFNYTQSVPVESSITTSRSFPTVAEALTETQAYRLIVGEQIVFRGVTCFVVDCVPDHRKARQGEGGEGIAEAVWTLAASFAWVP